MQILYVYSDRVILEIFTFRVGSSENRGFVALERGGGSKRSIHGAEGEGQTFDRRHHCPAPQVKLFCFSLYYFPSPFICPKLYIYTVSDTFKSYWWGIYYATRVRGSGGLRAQDQTSRLACFDSPGTAKDIAAQVCGTNVFRSPG